MRISTAVDHVTFNITDDRSECTEDNTDDQSQECVVCGRIALNGSFSSNNYNVVASEERLTGNGKCEADSSGTEDEDMIETCENRGIKSCAFNNTEIDTGNNQTIGDTDHDGVVENITRADEFVACAEFAAECETSNDSGYENGESGAVCDEAGRKGSGKEIINNKTFE